MMNEKQLSGFNVRVYALCIVNKRLLVLNESFKGNIIVKLPGGGLEFGEGTTDCLEREFKEELNLDVTVGLPFYIQEDFIPSVVNDNKQLLTLYFFVSIVNLEYLKIMDKNIKNVQWISLTSNNPFTLPVDRIVFDKLQLKLS